MATETCVFTFATAQTLTADLFPEGSDTATLSAQTCTEATNRKGTYTFTVTTGLSGWYQVVVKLSGTAVSNWWFYLANAATTTYGVDRVDTRSMYGALGDLGTTMKASVKTQVVDGLNTDTYAEPGQENPGATVSLAKKISYLYKAWRNKSTQDATTYKLYADDTTTVDQKATVSDDGTTFTSGEKATGP